MQTQPAKRGRGEKQLGVLEGLCWPPHIIEVEIGEDIVSKVMEFSDQGVFILYASGSVASVTLSGNAAAYEGPFQIITLSVNKSGSLTVALAGPYDQLVGGVVIGSLVAATKVVVGSILLETKNQISSSENSSGQNQEPASAAGTSSKGPSRELSEENESATISVLC